MTVLLWMDYEHTSIASLGTGCVLCDIFRTVQISYDRRLPYRMDDPKRCERTSAKGYIEGINMLSSMRLCSNVPAQSIVQTALGGYQSVNEYIKPGGRVYEQRECIYKALDGYSREYSVVKPQGGILHFP